MVEMGEKTHARTHPEPLWPLRHVRPTARSETCHRTADGRDETRVVTVVRRENARATGCAVLAVPAA